MTSPRDAPEIPGFSFTKHVGSGGFADVYLYEQHLPSRKVAVKVLHDPATEGDVLAQFHAEANVMAQLSGHPAIVAIYAADVSQDGRPYIVMEYCPPPTLAGRYRTERIELSEALEIGIRIASAVETVHRAGILHRDIKPHNILTSAFGAPKLTDFGIAGAAAGDDVAYGMSVPWSPPESFLEAPPADVRIDVYALGATVHSLIAGRSPFEVPGGANDNATLMSRIERQQVAPLTRPDVPSSLNRVLATAMSKNMTARQTTALDFARQLQDVQAELGLPQTRVEVYDASPSAPAAEEEDQRTHIRPVSIIVPEGLAQHSTALSPRYVAPEGGTLSKPARAIEPAEHTSRHALDSIASPAVEDSTGTAPTDTPATSARGVSWGVVVAAIALPLGALGLTLLVTGGDDDTPPDNQLAFDESSAPPNAVAAFVPPPSGLKATPGSGKVTFTWTNSEAEDGDAFGIRWTVANKPQAPQTLERTSFAAKASRGEIVCATVVLVRTNGSTSQATDNMCLAAR